jgi:hypothetical protein
MTKSKQGDSEDVAVESGAPDNIISVASGIGFDTCKIAVFLFILFIFLSSDVFVDRILSSPDNTYAEGRYCTTKGTIIQGLLLSFGFIIIHTLVTCGYA